MGASATVAVILVNHGQYAQQHLADCYASLKAQTYPSDLFTIFIVNNEAAPGDQAELARLAPAARVLTNAANCGWAGGNNTAIRVALQEGFDYVVMLNMDTVAEPDWLKELAAAAERSPDAHIFQSKILLHGTNRINSIGNRLHFLGFGYCGGYGRENHVPVLPGRIDYASGAAMLVKREAFERVGLFRDDYFMYYDDAEFCWRAQLAGFNLQVAEDSICYHKHNMENTFHWLYYLERNRLLTLLTLADFRTLLIISPCLVAAQVLWGTYCLIRGQGAAQWRAFQYLLRRDVRRQIRIRRAEIKALRIRRDADVIKRFTGAFDLRHVRHPFLRYVGNPLLTFYWTMAKRCIYW